ncbi:hypothetical protein CVT26_013457, partial [Gymnopilus dilepis]
MPDPQGPTSGTSYLLALLLLWSCWRILQRRWRPNVMDNIHGPQPSSWIAGSLTDLLGLRGWEFHERIAHAYGSVIRVKGIFGANDLYIFDPKALHHILVKEQAVYEETDAWIASNKLIFGGGLFASVGKDHARQRKMMNPVFSMSNLREQVPIFYNISRKVRDVFLQQASQGPQDVDIVDWMTRLSLELIGQSGLGYSFDELTKNCTPHRYGLASKQLVPLEAKSQSVTMMLFNFKILPFLAKVGTPRFRRWVVERLRIPEVAQGRHIVDTLYQTSIEIYESKKKSLDDELLKLGRGKDVISILMKANLAASEKDRLSEEEVLSQITTLTFAATDTTSSALSRILHLLAQHKDVQERLRTEIKKAREDNGDEDLPFDVLDALPYLDAVCRETLRLYPPIPRLLRVLRRDDVLPLHKPIKGINGQEINSIPVPKGTHVHISIMECNKNPEIWGPDAAEWKPERWLSPLPETLLDARVPGIYSHLMTFLGGGRSCIGFKFSLIEMKVVLSLLVESLEFSLSDKDIYWQMTGIVTPN